MEGAGTLLCGHPALGQYPFILRLQFPLQWYASYGAWAHNPHSALQSPSFSFPPGFPLAWSVVLQVVIQLLLETVTIKTFLKKQASPLPHTSSSRWRDVKKRELATLKISSASRLTQHRNSQAVRIYIQLHQSGEWFQPGLSSHKLILYHRYISRRPIKLNK